MSNKPYAQARQNRGVIIHDKIYNKEVCLTTVF